MFSVSELEKLCFSSPWSKEQFDEACISSFYHLYGYVEQDVVLAYVLVSGADDYYEIINIATHPDYRRKGYARELLTYFFAQEKIKQSEIILEVRSKNIAAQNLYRQFEFQQIHTRKKYYDDDDDALVMKYAPR